MKNILPIPMQGKWKNESVSSYALHAGAGTIIYYLAYLNIYLISLHCKLKVINNFKYMK